jgi:prefoldin subunit 5
MAVNPDAIKRGREELQQKIKEIQLKRAINFNPEELADSVIDLKAQIQGIQKEVDSLKASRSSPKALNVPDQKKDVQAQIKHYQAMTGD